MGKLGDVWRGIVISCPVFPEGGDNQGSAQQHKNLPHSDTISRRSSPAVFPGATEGGCPTYSRYGQAIVGVCLNSTAGTAGSRGIRPFPQKEGRRDRAIIEILVFPTGIAKLVLRTGMSP